MCTYDLLASLGLKCVVNVSTFHGQLDALLNRSYVLPSGHPNIPAMFAAVLPSWHTPLSLIVSSGTPLPAGHPSVEAMVCRYNLITALLSANGGCVANLTNYHGNVDTLLSNQYRLPAYHPSIPPMFAKILPAWHTNLSYILSHNLTYPAGHPLIQPLMCTFDFLASLGLKCVVNVSTSHGQLDALLNRSYVLPGGHPNIPAMFAAVLPSWHTPLSLIVSSGTPLPAGHPSVEAMVCRFDLVASLRSQLGCVQNITTLHGNVDVLLSSPYTLPSYHPSIPSMLSKVMAQLPWHTNLTYLIASKSVYPANHPKIEPLLCTYDLLASLGKGCVANVSSVHGNLNVLLNTSYVLPSYHPNIPAMFNGVIPWWHRNLTDIVLNGVPTPPGHPDLELLICRYDLLAQIKRNYGCVANLTIFHGNVDKLLSSPYYLPFFHPSIPPLFPVGTVLPTWHPSLAGILAANKTYPVGHPNISSLMCTFDLLSSLGKGCLANVSTFHANIDSLLSKPFSLPSFHPSIPAMFNAILPWWHPNLTEVVRLGMPYPVGHPQIESLVCRYDMIGQIKQTYGCVANLSSYHGKIKK